MILNTVKNAKSRVIAFYLPQFHPIKENDEWWGPGFTEWTNLAKARPLFSGHLQPRIPADLGFYDLRLPETRDAQAALARDNGVEGFCYWHYWFGGHRLLQRPFDEVLKSGEPSLPFCLGWANETWSGIWHGEPKKVLIEQTYPGEDDDRQHFEYLLTAFLDSRYITVDRKPVLVVYKPLKIPNPKARFDFWRNLAVKAGLPGLHIVGVNMGDFDDAAELGLDAAIISTLGQVSSNHSIGRLQRLYWGIRRRLPVASLRVIDYERAVENLVPDMNSFKFEAYPCAVSNWDNTPRSGARGLVLTNSTPESFRGHLRKAIAAVQGRAPEHKLVFLKSWNEWAEGNFVEPDVLYGKQYLNVIRDENS